MDRQTSLGSRSQGSFGHNARPARDLPRSRGAKTVPVRSVVAGLLAAVAPVVAFAPSVFAGDRFLFVRTQFVELGFADKRWIGLDDSSSPPFSLSLADLATSDAGWAALVASLLLAPFWFLAWRHARAPAGRLLGIVWSLSTTAAAYTLPRQRVAEIFRPTGATYMNAWGGSCWTLIAAGALLVAAFSVAPAPVAREAEEA